VQRRHRMPFGAEMQAGGGVRFRLWAPSQSEIGVSIDGAAALPLQRRDDGWHELACTAAKAGSLYRFKLADGSEVPDPASRFQPQDVHGPSEIIDPLAYRWGDADWGGRPWTQAVVYELHVGTFTSAGTFSAAIERLEHLATLGVTAIELMPLADFPGQRNWGYDGVLPYAPDSSYGRPEQLKAFIDAAHARGLMVILDVVYNHFGPDGNYLRAYAPQFFTDRHQTPWGEAINFDGPGSAQVRDFFIHNALYWLEEYHLDGLRLDAVHAIIDDGAQHLLQQLAQRVRADLPGRQMHLLLENEHNAPRWLERDQGGNPLLYTAQWNDDVHHALHVAATGESSGYYRDYDGGKLGRALAEGFAFQGEVMAYRGGPRGAPSAHLPADAFISFIQNHDQIGNRALGERISSLAPARAVRAIAAVYLLLPQIPMLFMGEEWAEVRPFLFFCDFNAQLAQAVRDGRRQEFSRFPQFSSAAMRDRIPDPQAASTFASSKIDWTRLDQPASREVLEWYRRILAARRQYIVPLVELLHGEQAQFQVQGDGAVSVHWSIATATVTLSANLNDTPMHTAAALAGQVIWQEGDMDEHSRGGPWSVVWTLQVT
jgi:malto-oligosyltrehalose trehalohydrolase